MKEFKMVLKSGRSERMGVFEAGRVRLCKDTMEELFSIPKGTKEIVVIVSDKETKHSYKVRNDYSRSMFSTHLHEYDDEDEDITLTHSDGKREHYPLFPEAKAEFLKHISLPCYVSVEY